MDPREEKIKAIIEKNFPDIRIDIISFFGEGFDNEVYLINDKYLFRFSRRESSSRELEREIAILHRIGEMADVEVPQFEHVGDNEGLKFVGYEKIDGTELRKEMFMEMEEEARENITREIADFIGCLQAFSLDEARILGIEENDFYGIYLETLEKSRERIFPKIDEDLQNRISHIMESGLEPDERKVLLHNDMKHEHILIDVADNKLKGIIDFGDITIGDPDHEVMFLYKSYGDEFLDIFLKYYPSSGDRKRLVAKLKSFWLGNVLRAILEWKEEITDEDISFIKEQLSRMD